jgi:hypothetical protein
MSATFTAAAKALADDPQLLANMHSAGSAEERAELFRAAGITVPTHADVNSHLAKMAGVAGGASAAEVAASAMDTADQVDTTVEIVGGASAAAGAGAA